MSKIAAQVLVAVLVMGISTAWRFPGYFTRSSSFDPVSFCRRTGEDCLENGHCCNVPHEICVRDYTKVMKYGPAVCKPHREVIKGKIPTLRTGEPCRDSGDCLEGCCQEFKRGPYVMRYECGPISRDVLCAENRRPPVSFNSILRDY